MKIEDLVKKYNAAVSPPAQKIIGKTADQKLKNKVKK